MDIFSVPAEVIDANVLPYLEWNDLLRLRRVCKWTKGITDSYLKVHPELAPEIEINEDDKTFDAFLKMGIPTNRIFLNNRSGDDFYHNGGAGARSFLMAYGHLIKFLRVDQLSLMIYEKEWDFLVALKNIESFEAGRLGGYPRELTSVILPVLEEKRKQLHKDPRTWNVNTEEMTYPSDFFERLKSLKIGNDECGHQPESDIFKRCDSFLTMGNRLQFISLPFSPTSRVERDYFRYLHASPLALAFNVMIAYVLQRSVQEPSVTTQYKVIDFVSYSNGSTAYLTHDTSRYFLELCDVALRNGVKLMNVASNWFQEREQKVWRGLDSPDFGIPVVSVINLHPSMIDMNMPNLEKIEIRSIGESKPGANWQRYRTEWPSLKTVDINVDSYDAIASEWSNEQRRYTSGETSTRNLFSFFFEDISRPSVTELRLRYSETSKNFPVPNTEFIVAACPNLKKLTLINWQGTNEALTILWNGLPALEEVSLECCKGLGNEAFVGEDVRSPVFLKLGNLKKLTLKGLNRMPKVTDKVFNHVLAHMKLTHLNLTSDCPIKSVTLAGVRALSEGLFAESIQKFPFKNWSLANVSEEEFRKTEATFRSFRML